MKKYIYKYINIINLPCKLDLISLEKSGSSPYQNIHNSLRHDKLLLSSCTWLFPGLGLTILRQAASTPDEMHSLYVNKIGSLSGSMQIESTYSLRHLIPLRSN